MPPPPGSLLYEMMIDPIKQNRDTNLHCRTFSRLDKADEEGVCEEAVCHRMMKKGKEIYENGSFQGTLCNLPKMTLGSFPTARVLAVRMNEGVGVKAVTPGSATTRDARTIFILEPELE